MYARGRQRASVARMQSPDFKKWSTPKVVLKGTQAKSLRHGRPIFAKAFTLAHPDIRPSATKTIWPELAVSRDGSNWVRPFQGQPLIPCGPAGSQDSRQIRMSTTLVILDDKILLLYGQSKRGHHTVDMQVDVGMATMRLDGFAAMSAGTVEGSLFTKPLRCSLALCQRHASGRLIKSRTPRRKWRS